MTFLYPTHRFFHPLSNIRMFHILAVPGESEITFTIYHNQAARAASPGAEEGNGCLGCLACGLSTCNKVSSAFSNQQASEIFTGACAGDSGIVISVEATTNEGRVAYTARVLVGYA